MSSKSPQELLLEELQEAREELATLDRQLEQNRPEFGLGVGSPEIAIWEMNLARRSAVLDRIQDIEAALARSKAGSYGLCEVCGTPIDPERLRILPHAKRCVRCASISHSTRTEIRSKQAG